MVSGLASETVDSTQFLVRLLTVAGVGGLATWTAVLGLRAGESARRGRLLNRVGDLLGDVTGDIDGALGRVADIAVPALADWRAIDLLEEDGAIRRAGVAHVDPARRELAQELGRRWPARRDDPQGAGLTIRTGASQSFADIPPVSAWPAGTRDPEHLRLLAELGMRSGMVVPLTARGRTLGAITLVAGEGGRRYGAADLALAEELGRRCALAIDNLRLLAAARAANRRLEESFALLDTLFGSAPIGLGFLDLQGRYVRVNDRLAEINGVPAAAHAGRTIDELVPDLDLERGRRGPPRHRDGAGRHRGRGGRRDRERARPAPRVARLLLPRAAGRARCSAWRRGRSRSPTGGPPSGRCARRRTATRRCCCALSEVGEGMVVLEGNQLSTPIPPSRSSAGYPLDELRAMESIWDLVPDWHRTDAQRRAELRVREGMVDPHYELVLVHRSGRLVGPRGRRRAPAGRRPRPARRGRPRHHRAQAGGGRARAGAGARAPGARGRRGGRGADGAARAGERPFDTSLEEHETLERIARLTVEEVADTCTILLAHPDRPARQAIAVARDPAPRGPARRARAATGRSR